MKQRFSGLSPHLDYIADDKPSKAVEQRFARLRAEVFDNQGRLRLKHRPEPKPQPSKKAARSLFIIEMLGGSAKLRPFVS